MSFAFDKLKNSTEDELISLHDKNSGALGGKTNREYPEMIRNELFRREIKRGNEIMTRLTWMITGLTFLIFILTTLLVYKEFF